MSLNPSTQANTAVDVIDGTITEYYNLVDECIRKSEVMPGKYETIVSPSYSGNCPVHDGSFTQVDIGCAEPKIVDIDNSYITADIRIPVKPNFEIKDTTGIKFFLGYRSSLDATYKYVIMCNHKVVYEQTFCGEESFILQSLIPEHVKVRKPYQYSTYDNVQNEDPNVCGIYVNIKSTEAAKDSGNKEYYVEIPIKIDINQFLLFTNFKYLPAFCGTWTIQLYFSSRNMILCPLGDNAAPKHFIQQGDYMSFANSNMDKLVTVGEAEIYNCMMHTTQFEMQYAAYDALKQRYIARPLAIPINKMDYGRFSGQMNNGATSCTYTTPLTNCESMFILPFIDDRHHTVCFNPSFDQLFVNISSFGNFPQQPINTFGRSEEHTRFMNMTLDALNLSNSPIACANKELMNSLQKDNIPKAVLTDAVVTNKTSPATNDLSDATDIDNSNFMIGIPFSNDIDFQGGLSYPNNLNLKLQATGSNIGAIVDEANHSTGNVNAPIGATVMFCKDALVMIHPLPYSNQPDVKLIEDKVV